MEELVRIYGEIALEIVVTAAIFATLIFTLYGDGPLHNLIFNVVSAAS